MKIKFKKEILNSLEYLRESRNYIYAVMLLFLAGIIGGFIFYSQLRFLDAILIKIVTDIKGLGFLGIAWYILKNNVISSIVVIILGIVLGIIPIMNSILNGIVLGYVLNKTWQVNGIDQFWRILPHGIFELPAMFISMALGLKLGMLVFNKNRIKEFKKRIIYSIILFLVIVLPLLVIASLIESALIVLSK